MRTTIFILLILNSTILLGQKGRKIITEHRFEEWARSISYEPNNSSIDSIHEPFVYINIMFGKINNKRGKLLIMVKTEKSVFGTYNADYCLSIKHRFFKTSMEYPKSYLGFSPEYIYGYFKSKNELYLFFSDDNFKLKSKYLKELNWIQVEN